MTCRKVTNKTHLFFCLSSAPVHCALIHIIGGLLGKIARVSSTGMTELIVGCRLKERAHMHMHNKPVFLPVFSASPLRFDSHHRWSSRQDGTCILHRDHRADRGMSPKRKSTHAHAQHTCFLPVFSAIQRCATHDAAILHLRVRVLVLLHKPLIPAEKKWGRRHTCLLECLSSSPVHCALILLLPDEYELGSRSEPSRLKEREHMHMHNTPVFCLS